MHVAPPDALQSCCDPIEDNGGWKNEIQRVRSDTSVVTNPFDTPPVQPLMLEHVARERDRLCAAPYSFRSTERFRFLTDDARSSALKSHFQSRYFATDSVELFEEFFFLNVTSEGCAKITAMKVLTVDG